MKANHGNARTRNVTFMRNYRKDLLNWTMPDYRSENILIF